MVDGEPIPTTEIALRKKTFGDIMNALSDADDDFADPDFDPAKLVGDLRDKVDSIQIMLNRMEGVAGWLADLAKPILKKAQSITKNHQRLRDYVAFEMMANGFMAVPGNAFKVILRESPWSMKMLRPATAEDFERFPGFVKMTRSYEWDTAKIKDAALTKTIGVQEIQGHGVPAEQAAAATPEQLALVMPASLSKGSWAEFKINVPESLEKKKKESKKK